MPPLHLKCHCHFQSITLFKRLLLSTTTKTTTHIPANTKKIDLIRNIGIIAHIDAGKTTTTERILAMVGLTKRTGNVDNGDTVMDFLEEERNRGITIQSASITFTYKDHTINLIDTPGHVDFGSEVDSSLGALDAAILLIDSSAGVQAQTMRVFQQAKENNLPLLIFLNKLDKIGSSIPNSLRSIRRNLSPSTVPIQGVVSSTANSYNIVNLIDQPFKIGTKDDDEITTKQSQLQLQHHHKQRQTMLESLSMFDDSILDLHTSSQSIPTTMLKKAIKSLTEKRAIYPVIFGSSITGLGITELMDSVIDYLPNPPPIHNPVTAKDTTAAAPAALIFKATLDPHSGPLAHTRTLSHPLKQGMSVWNGRTGKQGRIQSIHSIRADTYDPPLTEAAPPNSIVLIKGLKDFRSGDHLYLKGPLKKNGQQQQNENVKQNEKDKSVLSMTVIVDVEENEAKLREDLQRIAFEDPSLKVMLNVETGRHVLSGMGELHLEVVRKRISVPVTCGPLRLEVREILCKDVQCYTYSEGNCVLNFSVKRRCDQNTTGTTIGTTTTVTTKAPKIYQEPPDLHAELVKDVVMLSLDQGILEGYPIIGVDSISLTLGDGFAKLSEIELRNFVLRGMRSLLRSSTILLGDPLMRVKIWGDGGGVFLSGPLIKRIHSVMEGEVDLIEEGVTDVEGTLGVDDEVYDVYDVYGRDRGSGTGHGCGRDGQILETKPTTTTKTTTTITAFIPLKNLLGFSDTLRGISSGMASFSMEPWGYKIRGFNNSSSAGAGASMP